MSYRPGERGGELGVEEVLIVPHRQLLILMRLGQKSSRPLDVHVGSILPEPCLEEGDAAVVEVVVRGDEAQDGGAHEEVVFHFHAP